MRIINLVENTEGSTGCGIEHGLSFYIETEQHKLLMDTGQTDLLIKNAEKLGIDLTKVDTVILQKCLHKTRMQRFMSRKRPLANTIL